MSILRGIDPLTAVTGVAFFAGLLLVVWGIVGRRSRRDESLPRRRAAARRAQQSALGESLGRALPGLNEMQAQNLRLAGITPGTFALQRSLGLVVGLAMGAVISVLSGQGPVGIVVVLVLTTALGWFLPMLGAYDTARRARAELDQVIRMWVVLVAQQVSAGSDPAEAMLTAARIGKRPAWRLLYRHLLAAQQDRRQPWEGLADMVERYGIHNLAPIVSALGLAVGRGTRISEAVLTAAESLWENTVSAEREKAGRRAQIVVLPATGVALALAGILVYPPFTSLTGGGITGLSG